MKTKTGRYLSYFLPGLGDILWVAIFIGVLGLGPQMMNVDGDLGRHLTIGRYILDHGQVPVSDLFSHTRPGEPLTPHEWMSQVVFALAYRWLAFNGVILVCAMVIATSFWLVFRRARAASQGVLIAVLVTLLAVAASSLHWLSRPHIFTFLMLALWMLVLENMRRGRLLYWWLMPVLMLFWANLHGAFIAGFVTWGLFGFGLAWDAFWHRTKGPSLHEHFWRYYWLGGASSFLVTLVNPSGIRLWTTSVGYIGNRYLVSHTAEYLPPNFQDPSTWPFLFLIGLFVVMFGIQNRRLEAAQVFPAAAWLVMGLYSVRNIPLFTIVAMPALAVALDGWLVDFHHQLKGLDRFFQMDRRLLNVELSLRGFFLPILVVILSISALQAGTNLDFQRSGNQFDPKIFPVGAVDWLVDHPQSGRPFNYFPWGGYLLYRLWPEQKVFIDGQTDFYGENLTRQYEQILTLSPGWEEVLDQYAVDWVILPSGEALLLELRSRPEWSVLYEDPTAVVLRRTGP
jgi:hypothetical protein